MTDREAIEARIRDLERKLDSVHDEIYQLDRRLDRHFNELNRSVDQKSDRLSWDMIKIFGGAVFLIVLAVMLMLPFLILNTPKSQQTIIQVPARAIEHKPVEQTAPEIKMPPVEQTPVDRQSIEQNTTEQKPPLQSRTRESFLMGLFSDLSLTVQHSTMIGVIIYLFKLIVQ